MQEGLKIKKEKMRLWEGDLDEKPVSHSGSAFSGVKRADAAEAARPR